jgi:hypothetical protein
MEENVKVPFWQKTWFIVIMCLFIPPAGIALLWVTKKGSQVLRIVLTVVLAIYSIPWISGVFSGASSTNTQADTAEQTQQEEVVAETEVVEETVVEETPVEESAPAVTPDEYKAACTPVPYDELARYPDNYTYQQIVITGKVTQVIEDGDTLQCRLAIDGNYDQMVFIDYSGVSSDQGRILQDDYVTFWGLYYGLLTYETVLGASETVPGMIAVYSQIN